jgi:5-methylcytosine-specific restriction endonuclease McrA
MSKLNAGTLVLNRSWLAVQICSVKRALSLIYSGHAKVVDTDSQTYDFNDWSEVSQLMDEFGPEEFICSPSLKVKIPRVIVLVLYDKLPKRSVSFSRKNIFERDKYQCQYCKTKPPSKREALKWIEKKALTFDHVTPRSLGGRTTWGNIVTACFECNAKKGNRTLQELGWKLKKPPAQPKWHPILNIPLRMVPHKEWANFLDMAYWNTELENENDEPSDYESL